MSKVEIWVLAHLWMAVWVQTLVLLLVEMDKTNKHQKDLTLKKTLMLLEWKEM